MNISVRSEQRMNARSRVAGSPKHSLPHRAGVRAQGSGVRGQVAGVRVQGAGCRVQGGGYRPANAPLGIST